MCFVFFVKSIKFKIQIHIWIYKYMYYTPMYFYASDCHPSNIYKVNKQKNYFDQTVVRHLTTSRSSRIFTLCTTCLHIAIYTVTF